MEGRVLLKKIQKHVGPGGVEACVPRGRGACALASPRNQARSVPPASAAGLPIAGSGSVALSDA